MFPYTLFGTAYVWSYTCLIQETTETELLWIYEQWISKLRFTDGLCAMHIYSPANTSGIVFIMSQ